MSGWRAGENYHTHQLPFLELSKHYNPDLPHPNIMTEELNPISKAEDMWPVIISGSEKKPPYLF